ncbi:phosphatase PAP2 family protein [Cohnella caldifontis]|uniref:phosphatase PAP2 family protein n=1 Tax=Cohnella caldifontis TaxID=3027471 RepID=UPI0023ED25AB|nr:phosphatase PAP2 family protein [Cohnella sp. YIM B05605]
MKWAGRLLSAYGFALLAAVCFGVVVLLIGERRIGGFDSAVISAVQGWESPGLTKLMEGLTWFGRTGPISAFSVVVMVLLYFALGHRRELILFLAVMLGTSLLNKVLKGFFHRERPSLHRLAEETGYSFPSGHAMASFALFGVIAYLLWRHVRSGGGRLALAAVCALLTLAIGISRIYLGVHYPSDVIGGYLVSGIWLGLAIGFYERRSGNHKHRQGEKRS